MQFDIKRYASFSYFLILLISKFQIMKKTYIIPEALVVSLFANAPVLQDPSVPSDNEHVNAEDFEVKGASTGGSKNIWDEEW